MKERWRKFKKFVKGVWIDYVEAVYLTLLIVIARLTLRMTANVIL